MASYEVELMETRAVVPSADAILPLMASYEVELMETGESNFDRPFSNFLMASYEVELMETSQTRGKTAPICNTSLWLLMKSN